MICFFQWHLLTSSKIPSRLREQNTKDAFSEDLGPRSFKSRIYIQRRGSCLQLRLYFIQKHSYIYIIVNSCWFKNRKTEIDSPLKNVWAFRLSHYCRFQHFKSDPTLNLSVGAKKRGVWAKFRAIPSLVDRRKRILVVPFLFQTQRMIPNDPPTLPSHSGCPSSPQPVLCRWRMCQCAWEPVTDNLP